jgi:late competence protein required for DNA uptake (superfamily II DNA/RNA helicase)
MNKIGRCNSCGNKDVELKEYNKTFSCFYCLSLDRLGRPREEILKRILNNDRKRVRHSGKRDW